MYASLSDTFVTCGRPGRPGASERRTAQNGCELVQEDSVSIEYPRDDIQPASFNAIQEESARFSCTCVWLSSQPRVTMKQACAAIRERKNIGYVPYLRA